MDLGIGGRRALVCGASQGIGRAIAAELVAEGAAVAITSRSAERALAAADEIGAEGGLAWDADDPDLAPGLLDAAASALDGPVEVLVCNTGGPPGGEPLGFSRADWEAAHRSLVLSPLALVERALPAMRAAGWGRILNVSGTTVIEPSPPLVLSTVHRAGAHGLWKTLASQVATDGVTVNTIVPGRIATDRLGELFGSLDTAEAVAREQVPAARLGTVAEIAAAAAFLCSARASYITGQALAVDGGLVRAI